MSEHRTKLSGTLLTSHALLEKAIEVTEQHLLSLYSSESNENNSLEIRLYLERLELLYEWKMLFQEPYEKKDF